MKKTVSIGAGGNMEVAVTNLEEYKELYQNDSHIEPSKELAEKWLDAKIDVLEHLRRIYEHQNYPLVWGDLENGEYPNDIRVCGLAGVFKNDVHIYRGIDKLANLLGEELLTDGQYQIFYYKGYRVFEING